MRRNLFSTLLTALLCAALVLPAAGAGPVTDSIYLPFVAVIRPWNETPVLQWQRGGCYSSWCETGWYSSPALADVNGDGRDDILASAYSLWALDGVSGTPIWSVIQTMGAAGVKLYSTSSAILERIADGRFVLGYNILGSYAADWASRHPDLGIVLPKDYTVVMSRIGLVPQAAASPDLGRTYLEFFMSREGQTIMARPLQIAAVSPDVAGENTATTLQEQLGKQLRPVPVSPGLMVYLDQVKRARLISRWNEVLRLQ